MFFDRCRHCEPAKFLNTASVVEGHTPRGRRSTRSVDRIGGQHYNNANMPAIDVVVGRLGAHLAQRQLPSGGWAALRSSSQAAVEPTSLACIALGANSSDARDQATRFLLRAQNPNGSWPVFLGDDQEGAWVTSLVLIALRDRVEAIPERLKGAAWLVDSVGQESDWLWKWKFRTTDRHVRFDPDKFGWPWVPHTCSWVVPTAFSILALHQLPCACGLDAGSSRVQLGIEMLLDRACPGGGWNAGNGVVYGVALAPHPDDTAIALLALNDGPQEPVVRMSVDWLEGVAPTLSAPWSLAWSILALAAYQRPVEALVQALSHFPDADVLEDTSTLAIACLALDHQRTLAAFGISA